MNRSPCPCALFIMPPKRRAATPASSPATKKSRKRLPIEAKLDIIQRHERGEKTNHIAQHHGVSQSSINTILRVADSIKKAGETVSTLQMNVPTRSRDPALCKMESLLEIWIADQGRRRIPLSMALITTKALSLWADIQAKLAEEEKTKKTFNASSGWFDRFRKRARLRNIEIAVGGRYEKPLKPSEKAIVNTGLLEQGTVVGLGEIVDKEGPDTSVDGPSRHGAVVGGSVAGSVAYSSTCISASASQEAETTDESGESLPCHVFLPDESPHSFIDITTTAPSDNHLHAETEDHETPSYPSSHHTSHHTSYHPSCSSNCLLPVINQMFEVQVDLKENVRDMAHSLRCIAATLQKLVSTRNSTSAANSGEGSRKNPGRSQDTHRVRKYPSFKEGESDQSSGDEECLRRRNTFKAANPETGSLAETSQCKEPQVYIDVAEHPEHSKKRRLSTEKDNNVEGNIISLADWKVNQIKQELEISQCKEPQVYIDVAEHPEHSKKRRLSSEKDNNVEGNISLADWKVNQIEQELEVVCNGILKDNGAYDVEVKQELNESMEPIKEEHDIDVTGDY